MGGFDIGARLDVDGGNAEHARLRGGRECRRSPGAAVSRRRDQNGAAGDDPLHGERDQGSSFTNSARTFSSTAPSPAPFSTVTTDEIAPYSPAPTISGDVLFDMVDGF